ncbi:tyrosine-protein phosphatase [Streptomyces sp. NBC_00876]|uniref:tyrosine-protein phosphatase n=1 Tax=Streptomyces sp. NBC_00876 TaxID=2975853 RepID=UPI00386BEC06|nr:tyrosine-protein phosphatase [Streptomyces sp. NBC_00876]
MTTRTDSPASVPDGAPDIPGVRNFRDAGGVGTLRRGALYRSGALDALTAQGAERLRELGLRSVIDLRSTPEVAAAPDLHHGLGPGLAHRHIPVFSEQRWPADQRELYPAMAEAAGRSSVAVIRRLLAPGALPALVHCASGKDRTGVTVAIIQTLLGASEAEITEDFVRSNAALGLDGSAAAARPGHGSLPVTATHLRHAMIWIRSHYGSVPACLLAHSAKESELEALRTALA